MLRGALDGRLRAGSNLGVVNGMHSRNIRHDDLRRLERTMQELLPDQNVSARSSLILWLGR